MVLVVALVSLLLVLLVLALSLGAVQAQRRLKQTASRLLRAHGEFGDRLTVLEEAITEGLGEERRSLATPSRGSTIVKSHSDIVKSHSEELATIACFYRAHSHWRPSKMTESFWVRTYPETQEHEEFVHDQELDPYGVGRLTLAH